MKGYISLREIADKYSDLGLNLPNLHNIVYRSDVEVIKIPITTGGGVQDANAVPKWWADKLIARYQAAQDNN